MAHYTVTHTCGHKSEQQLYGKEKDRQSRLEWLATVPCLTCKRENDRLKAEAASASLPALQGSEKQVAWATTIRAQALASIEEQLSELERRSGQSREINPEIGQALEALKAETLASWWIDRRGSTLSLLREKRTVTT